MRQCHAGTARRHLKVVLNSMSILAPINCELSLLLSNKDVDKDGGGDDDKVLAGGGGGGGDDDKFLAGMGAEED